MGPGFRRDANYGAANNRLAEVREARRISGCAVSIGNRDCRPILWARRARRLAVLLLKGVLVGIIIAVPAGPVGVLCIRRTIFHGQLAGFLSGLGAATADAVFGIIAASGLTVISDLLLDYRDWLRVGGGAFLLYIGITAFIADPLAGTQAQRDPEDLLSDYFSTFALTI